uniref:Gamma interferon inducible lysosomal thiol reductase n=1 Tax=Panagrellus redivivus TaxID=6233 RepID=A0A7E4VZI8_PANRE
MIKFFVTAVFVSLFSLALANKPTSDGNIIHCTVYIESKCRDTNNFMEDNLVPTFDMLKNTGRFNLTVIPFGKARCLPKKTGDFACSCQHGADECELNSLQNCAIHYHKTPNSFMPIISCIQGEANLDSAIEKCKLEYLRECASGPQGRALLAEAGLKTRELDPKMTFVPWVVLDGKRAYYHRNIDKEVCGRLEPMPEECREIFKRRI